MASEGQWKGKGVVGGDYLAKSQNKPSTGARKGKGGRKPLGGLSRSQDQAEEAPRKGKGKGKGVARGDSLNDDEPRFDHNHAECIRERELAWGTPTDSDSDTPLSPQMISPERMAQLKKDVELKARKALTIHRIEFRKLFAALDALEAQELSSPASQDLVNTTD